MEYIQEANLIIIPVLTVFGFSLKKSNFIKGKYIPLLLLATGATLGALNGGMTRSILEGAICAGVAMGITETTLLIKKG